MALSDRPYALFVGRFKLTKGLPTLLAAWGHLQERIPLFIVGDGPERAGLEQEVQERGLSSVVFRGKLPRHQTIAAMQMARFLVFPSGWYESFPMTIAEAFACATPVLCSRLGSMQEIVSDGRTGMHFTAGDAEDLARKAEWAWKHPAEMRDMGREARREYLDKYTAEKNYSQLMDIYEHAISKPAGMAAACHA